MRTKILSIVWGLLLVGAGAAHAQTTYKVGLSWDAPASSSDPVVGYQVYRATGAGAYSLLNATPVTALTYTDSTVADGTTYNYEVVSVDAQGVQSAPSNVYTAVIPGAPGPPTNLTGTVTTVTTTTPAVTKPAVRGGAVRPAVPVLGHF